MLNKILNKILRRIEALEEAFDDLLDNIFPYKKMFYRMKSDEYLDYYHARHSRPLFLIFLLLIPFFIYYIFTGAFFISAIFAPITNGFNFIVSFFSGFIFMSLGFFFTFDHQFKGPFFLWLSVFILSREPNFGDTYNYQGCLFLLLLLFLHLCRLKRFYYYKDLASNVMQNKMRIEVEDQELDHLLTTYSSEFDSYIKNTRSEE